MPDATEPSAFDFDVFLSHNSQDKESVRRIAEKLRAQGVKCWFDEWILTPGHRWVPELASGLKASSSCIIFFGQHGLGAWHDLEQELALSLSASAKAGRWSLGLIPVRLPGAPPWRELNLPPFLNLYTWVDFGSVDDDLALRRLIAAIRTEGPAPRLPEAVETSPYIGLRSFSEKDHQCYFGRERYVIDLLERLRAARTPRFTVVLGASGSGKSSLLHAGLLPRLRQQAFGNTTDWHCIAMRPGQNAMVNLQAALRGNERTRNFVGNSTKLTDEWLHTITMAALSNDPGMPQVALLIDQFEELITYAPADENRRSRYQDEVWRPFWRNLRYAACEPSGRLHVIIALRRDFFDEVNFDPEANPIVSEHELRLVVESMTESELRYAIERPALTRGVEFDPGLVEALIEDFRVQRAGSLPFLQEALCRLWELRENRRLTIHAYRAMGRLRGAINSHAEKIFSKLPAQQQNLAQALFVHLVRISDDGSVDTKRRVPLLNLPGGREAIQLVLELSTSECRLLSLDAASINAAEPTVAEFVGFSANEQPTSDVEIAHEALIGGWRRLHNWLNDSSKRPIRIQLRRLESQAKEWLANQEHRNMRLRGPELQRAVDAIATLRAESSPDTVEYVQHSIAFRRRKRIFTSTAALLLVILACSGVWWGFDKARLARQMNVIKRLNACGVDAAFTSAGWDINFRDDTNLFESINLVSNLQPIVKLDLSKLEIPARSMHHLPSLKLIDLDISEATISIPDINSLLKIPSLQKVKLCKVTTVGELDVNWRNLKQLVYFDFCSGKLNTNNWSAVQECTNLESIYLENSNVSDFYIDPICRLPRLKNLGLSGTRITDEGAKLLANAPLLTSVTLNYTFVGDATVIALSGSKSITELWLKNCKVSDNGLIHIGGMAALNKLSIPGTKITDAGLLHISGVKSLKYLYVGGCEVSARGIIDVCRLLQLEEIYFPNTLVDDSVFPVLVALKSLKSVNVGGSKVSEAGLAGFRKQRPDVKIVVF